AADQTRADLFVCIAITRVEAPHEPDHDFLLRVFGGLLLDPEAVGNIQRQRLFREHMLAGLEALNDLVRMQRGRRRQENRVQFRVCKQVLVIAVEVLDPELIPRPLEFAGDRTASRDEFGTQCSMREIQCMALPHASDTSYAYAKRCIHPRTSLTRSPRRILHNTPLRGTR